MNFFGKPSGKSLSIDQEELRERLVDAINRELTDVFEKQRQLRVELKYGAKTIAYEKRESSQFARIWTLAAAFGLLSVIPLVMLRDKYPWAVLAVVIFGSICTIVIDILSTRNDQKRMYFMPKVILQQSQPLDLSHREAIDVSMFYEREYWSKHFGISEDELREAVLTVGRNIATLKAYLEYKKSKGSIPPPTTSPS
jgi:Protein of unknown function (DUF3606).